MISFIRALAAGRAMHIVLRPEPGATRWRLLRRGDDNFAGADDPDALLVYEGDEKGIVDIQALADGATYYYRAYDRVGVEWVASASVSASPATTFEGLSVDPLLLLRERIDVGMRAMVARGVLIHPKNHIQVLLGPPALDNITPPVVTLHSTHESPAERALGDEVAPDARETAAESWDEFEGWIGRYEIAVIGWSLNGDERALMRRALRDIVVANLPVFDGLGVTQVAFEQQDSEDMERFTVPMYQTLGAFSCVAPVVVKSTTGVIHTVDTTIIEP